MKNSIVIVSNDECMDIIFLMQDWQCECSPILWRLAQDRARFIGGGGGVGGHGMTLFLQRRRPLKLLSLSGSVVPPFPLLSWQWGKRKREGQGKPLSEMQGLSVENAAMGANFSTHGFWLPLWLRQVFRWLAPQYRNHKEHAQNSTFLQLKSRNMVSKYISSTLPLKEFSS